MKNEILYQKKSLHENAILKYAYIEILSSLARKLHLDLQHFLHLLRLGKAKALKIHITNIQGSRKISNPADFLRCESVKCFYSRQQFYLHSLLLLNYILMLIQQNTFPDTSNTVYEIKNLIS